MPTIAGRPSFWSTPSRADDRTAGAIPQHMLDEADRRGGGGRKLLAAGEGDFRSSYSVMPAGYAMPLHRHDYEELVVVLDGGCRWCDSRVLEARDSVVMPPDTVHGFTCGEHGMQLLTVARGPFRTELEAADSVSHRDIADVLAARREYDQLTAYEQAVVRAAWAERMDARRDPLDLAREFSDRGRSYAELDENDQVVHGEPSGEDRAHTV